LTKVLITGCNGLLGQKLVRFAPAGFHVLGVDLHEQSVAILSDYRSVDLSQTGAAAEVARQWQPAWILNAAAFTDVDGAEIKREQCYRVNVTLVENLIQACSAIGAKMVHVSTDYIFDGRNGPYREEDPPNPIGYYGATKLAGEEALLNSTIQYAIARTMVLYGQGVRVRPNFVTWLVATLSQRQPVRIVNDQFGNTTLADELAEGIWQMVLHQSRGIYHLAGREIVDRYTFALKIAHVFELDAALIEPVATAQLQQRAPRPMKSGLVVQKAMNELGVSLSDVESGLRRLAATYRP
jgi:dTDP-4-dehydrorhamnose reductase